MRNVYPTNPSRFYRQFLFIILRASVKLLPIGQLYLLALTNIFTLEFYETLSVGIGESSHGAIMELLKESQLFCSIQESLPGGAQKKNIRIRFLHILSSKWHLLHQQLSS